MPQDKAILKINQALEELYELKRIRELLVIGLEQSEKISKRNQVRLHLLTENYCSIADACIDNMKYALIQAIDVIEKSQEID